MSCGLGAIVLVFMLVKHNVDPAIPQTEFLRRELATLMEQAASLQRRISTVEGETGRTTEEIETVSADLARIEAELARKRRALIERRRKVEALEDAIKKAPKAKKDDVVEDPQAGEEDYLIGLTVDGAKVGILVDASASMTDEKLIDVIRRKNGPAAGKQAGPKWQRTKRIVRWLLARLPRNADVSVIAFNGKATPLGTGPWLPATDATALGAVFKDLDALVPEGSTNLQAGLAAMAGVRPTNLYVITDGLPTEGVSNFRSLNPFSACSSLWGRSNTISGECRWRLFEHTLKTSRLDLSVPVNVVLLPIEGDPRASIAFWSWAAVTGGLLISPAGSWP